MCKKVLSIKHKIATTIWNYSWKEVYWTCSEPMQRVAIQNSLSEDLIELFLTKIQEPVHDITLHIYNAVETKTKEFKQTKNVP